MYRCTDLSEDYWFTSCQENMRSWETYNYKIMSKQENLKVFEDWRDVLKEKNQDTTTVQIMIEDIKREIEYEIEKALNSKQDNA